MPNPHKGEDKSDFTSRFMGDEAMKKRYPDSKQRYAVAMSHWDKKQRNKKIGKHLSRKGH